MALSQRLDIKLGQHLTMTPQLRQAIKLLELSHIDLAAFIDKELQSNPFLEKTKRGDRDGADGFAGGAGTGRGEAEDWRGLDQRLTRELSLVDYVAQQISLDFPPGKERLIAQHLLGFLDERGYFIGDLQEISVRLKTNLAALETILFQLQKMDPPGIFARDLRECLLLQLFDRDHLDPLMERLLSHLDLIGKGAMRDLQLALGVSAPELDRMVAQVRTLDPKPGLHFGLAPIQTIEPDVLVTVAASGIEWHVELNPATLPRLIVNREYRATVGKGQNKDEQSYLADRMAAASWLVKALDQRADNLLKVASEIVKYQAEFLHKGMGAFRPLLRRDLAVVLGVHESTISRVAANKFMATPRGTFALSDFFGVGLGPDHETGPSAKSVMYLIKEQISQERHPLSDEQLVKRLSMKGIKVARRTVAKYRESMKIPSSSERRRIKVLPLRQ